MIFNEYLFSYIIAHHVIFHYYIDCMVKFQFDTMRIIPPTKYILFFVNSKMHWQCRALHRQMSHFMQFYEKEKQNLFHLFKNKITRLKSLTIYSFGGFMALRLSDIECCIQYKKHFFIQLFVGEYYIQWKQRLKSLLRFIYVSRIFFFPLSIYAHLCIELWSCVLTLTRTFSILINWQIEQWIPLIIEWKINKQRCAWIMFHYRDCKNKNRIHWCFSIWNHFKILLVNRSFCTRHKPKHTVWRKLVSLKAFPMKSIDHHNYHFGMVKINKALNAYTIWK